MLGLGLLVEWAAGDRLPGPLVLPVGFALLIGLTQLLTWAPAIAPATWVVVLLVALAGLALRARTLRGRPLDPWAALVGIGVFVAYLGPVILSGKPGFGGYVLLGDPAIHLELADRVTHAGATTSGMVPSSVTASLQSYFDTSYPTGTHTAFGSLGQLVPVDLAWTWQPFLSWMIALGALAIYALITPVVADRRMRALVAFVAAQPGLVYAFAMQGALKELATITTVAVVFALVPWLLTRAQSWRAALPVAVAAAGTVGAIDVAAAAWLGPVLLGAVAALWWRGAGVRRIGVLVAAFAAAAAVLAAPALAGVTAFKQGAQVVLTSSVEMGNLVRPIGFAQSLGIWPSGDFRLPLDSPDPYILMGLVVAGIALGGWWLVRSGHRLIVGFALSFLLAWWYVERTGSPWADAKALAILSPTLVLLALLGGVSLAAGGRRVEGGALLAVIAGGVLWTNALAYHDVQLSHWDRLHELEELGERHADQGPIFSQEFEEFAKYFLRDGDVVNGVDAYKPGPAGTSSPEVELRYGYSAPLGDFGAGYLGSFRTLVVRRAPVQSRAPAGFELAERTRWYDVWRRDDAIAPGLVAELPLGTPTQRGAVAQCSDVEALAAQGSRLAYVTAPRLVVGQVIKAERSPTWYVDGSDPATLRTSGPGVLRLKVTIPEAGRYALWAQASLTRPLTVLIDGVQVAEVPEGLSPRGPGEDVFAGEVELPSGPVTLEIRRPGGDPSPGAGGEASLLGPVTLAPAATADPGEVEWIEAGEWRTLCGEHLDWVEVYT